MPYKVLLSLAMSAFVILSAMSPASAQFMATRAEQAIMVDLSTGRILLERNADQRMPTSSMSKLLTVLMAFDALRDGRITLDQETIVSERAWAANVEGSVMFLEVDETVSIRDLLRGIIVVSGNDASLAMAETLAGDETSFAAAMNARAQSIGMSNSHFANASGLPDPQHYSTARDLARLASHIIRTYPQYYSIFSERSYRWGEPAAQPNRLNRVYDMNPAIDGMKTGHTEAAGYGAVISGAVNGRRLVLVMNGLGSQSERVNEAVRLMNWGLNSFAVYDVFEAGQEVGSAEVWRGQSARVPLVLDNAVRITLSPDERRGLNAAVVLDAPVAAPVRAGTQLGMLVVNSGDTEFGRYPVYAGSDVTEIGLMGRMMQNAAYLATGGAQ